ncbi:MAG: hypothetical protein ACFFDN_23595 [Candidatus Hodarchaeota archaeon]
MIHIYHYNTHSEQRFFLGREHPGLFDIISLNGNIVSHTPSGVASFVANTGKKYFIDPQTHAFQHPTIHLKTEIKNKDKEGSSQIDFKPSIVKLAKERLRGPFAQVIKNDRPILPIDFFKDNGEIDNNIITQICENVIYFQTETMTESLDEEALEFMGEYSFNPEFIIAPYFYLSPRRFEEWLKITLACLKKTKEIVTDLPVFLALVVSKEALDEGSKTILEMISNDFTQRLDGILLWIDEHTEEDLSKSSIQRYIMFLKELKKITNTVYNSHGGYLSVLLGHSELDNLISGVGHSINYGESRSVIPIGGGIPMARFYYPSIHSRLRFGDSLSILLSKELLSSEDSYLSNVCSCRQCAKLIKEKKTVSEAFLVYGESKQITFRRRAGSIVRLEYPTKEAKQAASCHYLYNKAKEFKDIEAREMEDLLVEMENAYENIASYSGDELVAHLINWKNSIEQVLY